MVLAHGKVGRSCTNKLMPSKPRVSGEVLTRATREGGRFSSKVDHFFNDWGSLAQNEAEIAHVFYDCR